MTREFKVQYSDYGVPFQIVQRPLLEEHIRLVDKNDVFPRSGNIKDPLKGTIKTHSRRPRTATFLISVFAERGGYNSPRLVNEHKLLPLNARSPCMV